jgi:hypothetical protein
MVKHSKFILFQLARVAVLRPLFARLLERISQLRWPVPRDESRCGHETSANFVVGRP